MTCLIDFIARCIAAHHRAYGLHSWRAPASLIDFLPQHSIWLSHCGQVQFRSTADAAWTGTLAGKCVLWVVGGGFVSWKWIITRFERVSGLEVRCLWRCGVVDLIIEMFRGAHCTGVCRHIGTIGTARWQNIQIWKNNLDTLSHNNWWVLSNQHGYKYKRRDGLCVWNLKVCRPTLYILIFA